MALVTITPRVFTAPGLPALDAHGFRDTFTRPDADTLGVTEGVSAKAWEVHSQSTGASTWGPTGNGTATMKTVTYAGHFAVADALTADGTLTAVLATYDPVEGNRFGLTVRFEDVDNFIELEWRSPTSSFPRLFERVNGVSTTLQTSDVALASTSRFDLVLDGSSVTVKQDGVATITSTLSGSGGATKHGMYAFSVSDFEWDSIEFTPA